MNYGFNLATMACGNVNVNPWPTIFGADGDATREILDDSAVKEEEESIWFPQCAIPPKLVLGEETCHPDVCRMSSGICVDCTRCSRHCRCVSAAAVPDREPSLLRASQSLVSSHSMRSMHSMQSMRSMRSLRTTSPSRTSRSKRRGPRKEYPPVCDPATCKQLICGDCSRCTSHCICNWDRQRRVLRNRSVNEVEDAYLQGLNRQRVFNDMHYSQKPPSSNRPSYQH
eukprot:Nitzschia sp. Nitz4//scaffold11_size288233//214958//215638//NITZ4_000802-RA/size288233-processed-gene-0.240-mRNA-1//-1//CDS//3329534158//6946//frame0